MSGDGLASTDRPPPLRTTVLAGATAAALVLGGWWWTSNAPPPSTGLPALAGRPAIAPVIAEPVEPADADGNDRPDRSEPPDVPAPAEILGFDLAEVETLLPEAEATLRRQAGVLTSYGTIDYSGVVPSGNHYLLEVACLGDGALRVSVTMPGGSTHRDAIECDGTVVAIELTAASTGSAMILLRARTSSLVGAVAQLVPL